MGALRSRRPAERGVGLPQGERDGAVCRAAQRRPAKWLFRAACLPALPLRPSSCAHHHHHACLPPATAQVPHDEGGESLQLLLNITCHHTGHDDFALAVADVEVAGDAIRVGIGHTSGHVGWRAAAARQEWRERQPAPTTSGPCLCC